MNIIKLYLYFVHIFIIEKSTPKKSDEQKKKSPEYQRTTDDVYFCLSLF